VSYLIRSWNVFHGRTQPPGRRAYLREAVELAVGDEPDVLCLQEVPIWGVSRLEAWSGMTAIGDETVRPALGLLPLPAALARRLTDLHHGFIRSALVGQANAVLVQRRLKVIEHLRLVLNDRGFRRQQSRLLGLDLRTRLLWAKERRLCQAVRIALPAGRALLVLNVHASHVGSDRRIADAELLRAADFAEELARPGDIVVLAGDFNISAARSRVLARLSGPGSFSAPGPGVDHILVRGAPASALGVWPPARRTVSNKLLSDHALVELSIE
jgi:endonuclease/exonuclease/phosphatase family metal-dependent hydrolase